MNGNAVLGMYVVGALVFGLTAMIIAATRNLPVGRFVAVALLGGPLGPLAAAIAPSGDDWRVAVGTRAVMCLRCCARQNVPTEALGFECWQCHENFSFEDAPGGLVR